MNNKEKLTLLAEQADRKAQLTVELATLTEQRRSAFHYADTCKAALAKETSDVEKLDGKSLANLFYTVTGRMDQKRVSEIAEADTARERYELAQAHANELASRVAEMEAELSCLGDCDKDLELLLADMTAETLKRGGETADQVAGITERIRRNTAEAAELGNLVVIGRRLLAQTDEMIPFLQSELEYDRSAPTVRRGAFERTLTNKAISDHLRRKEDQVSSLVALARIFRTDLVDLPPVGRLQILQNTFKGTHRESNCDQLEAAISELEGLRRTVERSVAKLERIQPLRADAADRAKRDLIETLVRIRR